MIKVGVIIGRFQVPELHEAHKKLIEYVSGKNDICLILLGESQARGTIRDPMPAEVRAKMIMETGNNILVRVVHDDPSDVIWSKRVDKVIGDFVAPKDGKVQVRLYGGRDSFIPHYKGQFKTIEVKEFSAPSGTEIRNSVGIIEQMSHPMFRRGMIAAAKTQYPRTFPTVDIAVLGGNKKQEQVLMAKKIGEKHWRFPGGFVDPSDLNLENAARRELREETGLIAEHVFYIKSFKIDDWRFRESKDGIMTALFGAYATGSLPKAMDDISTVGWQPLDKKFAKKVAPIHRPLYIELINSLTTRRKNEVY